MTRRLMEVIRSTPVRNEAQISGKPLLLSSDRADQRVWERKEILCREQGGIDTPDIPHEDSLIPLATPSHDALRLLKAALKVVVAAERTLDGPRDLRHETTAQIGLYAHLCQDSRTSGNRPPHELLTPLPRHVPRAWMDPRGSAEEIDKVFLKTC